MCHCVWLCLSNLSSLHLFFAPSPCVCLGIYLALSLPYGNFSNYLPLCGYVHWLPPSIKNLLGYSTLLEENWKLVLGKMYLSGRKLFIFNLSRLKLRSNNTSSNLHFLKSYWHESLGYLWLGKSVTWTSSICACASPVLSLWYMVAGLPATIICMTAWCCLGGWALDIGHSGELRTLPCSSQWMC